MNPRSNLPDLSAEEIGDIESLLAQSANLDEAEAILTGLAAVFHSDPFSQNSRGAHPFDSTGDTQHSNDARYRALVEQIPAIVFMAYLDRGIGESYISPEIEASLGFSQAEWLEDPVRWYRQIHPDDKSRWSIEAAEMFLSGKPLRSAYRVFARDGRVIWFHCEAKMIRHPDGRPWFIHGVAVDITELKRTQEALEEERTAVAAIHNIVAALVVVLDTQGRIVRFNRTCERITDYTFEEVEGKHIWDLFMVPEEFERFKAIFEQLRNRRLPGDYEGHWVARDGTRRLINWSSTVLPAGPGPVKHIIATGIDITERKRLEKTILEISGREQRRIGQDLHDGLGQHLTGIAFMSKVLEEALAEKSLPEAAAAAKIVRLVNEAIRKTKELARGLLPVMSDSNGLMTALELWAREVEDLFNVSCSFECDIALPVEDSAAGTHLYHIAQEAVHNAIKHGRARHIRIRLAPMAGGGSLTVTDDGCGFPEILDTNAGMGLHIMNYRAKIIGGSLDVQKHRSGGTAVICLFPNRKAE